MNKKERTFIVVMFILALTITIGVLNQPSKHQGKGLEEDTDYVSTDNSSETIKVDLSTAEKEDGKMFNQSEYKDKNLVITFTNSGCTHCNDQALEFEKLKESFNFEHFYIPAKETTKATANVLDAIGIEDYNLLIDRGELLLDNLSVKRVPTSLVKRKGEDSFHFINGVLREDSVEGDYQLENYID